MGVVTGGGGGAAFNGGTITSGLTVNTGAGDGLVTLTRNGAPSAVLGVLSAGGGVYDARVDVTGVGGGGGTEIFVANGSVAGTSVTLDGRGYMAMFTETGQRGLEAWDDVGNVLRFALLVAGQPMIGVTAAPADADLAASQCALWFDATNGAAKLMVKAKSANGTVVTGSLALA